ncbi:MAG TPA: nuclear transport factor 2 family protein [Burkholderiaceae bacterium]|nr:nuclear transport factor 2 family protein [Burkholderiaceae bacterium]
MSHGQGTRRSFLRLAAGGALAVSAASRALGADDAHAQVWAAELAFARSMAERDFEAFSRHVAEDTVFFGQRDVLRGKAAVLAGWKAFFEGPQAPFSWAPDRVEVLASGALALSTGPVRNARGEVIARFNSVWQREADGRWRVVFDKGGPPE